MAHLMASQALSGVSPAVAGSQPALQPMPSNVGHNYGMSGPMPPQAGQQVSQQAPQQSSADQKHDLIARVRPLAVSLKESLATLMRVAASNIKQNSQIDSGSKSNEESVPRFDKALEDFFSICNQIELHLKTILECSIQARDSHMYLPFNVSKTDSTSDPNANLSADSISYNQYLMTIKGQVNFAKAVHDMLVDGSKRIGQTEAALTAVNPAISSTTAANSSVV